MDAKPPGTTDSEIPCRPAALMTAGEAAAALGVTRATLYAYVSRGLVRSEQAGERRGLADPVALL